jgi:OmpA-OmpF porin, OOP family
MRSLPDSIIFILIKEEYRMRHIGKYFIVMLLWFFIMIPPVHADTDDAKGCSDHPMFTRMPGFYIDDCEQKEFEQLPFVDSKGKEVVAEGKSSFIKYVLKSGEKAPSELQIMRNFVNAIKRIGGVKTYEASGKAYFKVEKGGALTWIHVRAFDQGEAYSLRIVEKKAMVQQIEADASSMAQNINQTGKVALYGIYFDFNKADVKPESEPTMEEIAKLMQQNPVMKLHVVGHTDNVGDLHYNIKLSRTRAEAVVKALTSKHGIGANRLNANGIGPLAPLTSNKTEDGRAKNRRVELVEQ